jgi:catechol 2,3-dioxygenase-like lactoylglutathione lyase family enzyme
MMTRVVPMVHVPDVKATVAWYESIGFTLRATHEEPGCPMDWASLFLGSSEVMLSAGGRPATSPRRDVDLYVHVEDVDQCFDVIAKRAEVLETPHPTEYGMREFIIRDLNGFWITFGQPCDK